MISQPSLPDPGRVATIELAPSPFQIQRSEAYVTLMNSTISGWPIACYNCHH